MSRRAGVLLLLLGLAVMGFVPFAEIAGPARLSAPHGGWEQAPLANSGATHLQYAEDSGDEATRETAAEPASSRHKRTRILANAAPGYARTVPAQRFSFKPVCLDSIGYFLAIRPPVRALATADDLLVSPSFAVVLPLTRSPPSDSSFLRRFLLG